MIPTAALPSSVPVTGLGAVLGPVVVISLVATLVALGVIVAGLIAERRDAAARRRRQRVIEGMHRPRRRAAA